MSTKHVVQPGECLSSIACHYGFLSWKTIYDHPDNADFRKKRTNPNVIRAGDEIAIPDKGQRPKSAPVKHRETVSFVVKKTPTRLRIEVRGMDDKPLTAKPYELVVGDRTLKGKTTGAGLIEQPLDPRAQEGQVTVWLTDDPTGPRLSWTLKIGHLDPVDEIAGMQGRLNNLGFPCGPVDGELGPRTQSALLAFQLAMGLEATGELDAATKDKLLHVHGKT